MSVALGLLDWRRGTATVTMGVVFARNEGSPVRAGVTSVTLFAQRISWYLHALGVNPLIRASDRLEALAVLGVLVTALMAAPVAAQAGTQIYDTGVRTADAQAHSRHSVEAVVVDGSVGLPTDLDGSTYVRVQWHQGAQLRTDEVVSAATLQAGAPFTLWLDDTGKVVAAPLTIDDAKVSAAGATGTVWVILVACSALAAYLVRLGLDRSRVRAWERELNLLAHNDDGWANRRT